MIFDLLLELVVILIDFLVNLEFAGLPMHIVFLVELVHLIRYQILSILYGFLLL